MNSLVFVPPCMNVQVIEAADVVIEVLDARDPLGSRCPQVEEAVVSRGPNKRLILLLNKIGPCFLTPYYLQAQWMLVCWWF